MNEQFRPAANPWFAEFEAAVCDSCGWSFLFPMQQLPEQCPHCHQRSLSRFRENLVDFPNLSPPELCLPFDVTQTQLTQSMLAFSRSVPFAPQDLSAPNLVNRLQRIYLPVWLVDCHLLATWQAETGFDYEVVSHQDHFSGGKWVSRQVKEGRIRWEARLGKVDRQYRNLQTAAMDEHQRMIQHLGQYSADNAQPFASENLQSGSLRLPNRSSSDAWSDAEVALRSKAAEDCCRAASAGHIRNFTWQPEFLDKYWTLLLLPLFSTYYLDDSGAATPVYLNGQSGHVAGSRKPSMKKAKSSALIIFLASAAVFFLSLLAAAASVALPALLVLSIIGTVVAIGLGFASIYPLAVVWWFNRKQASLQM